METNRANTFIKQFNRHLRSLPAEAKHQKLTRLYADTSKVAIYSKEAISMDSLGMKGCEVSALWGYANIRGLTSFSILLRKCPLNEERVEALLQNRHLETLHFMGILKSITPENKDSVNSFLERFSEELLNESLAKDLLRLVFRFDQEPNGKRWPAAFDTNLLYRRACSALDMDDSVPIAWTVRAVLGDDTHIQFLSYVEGIENYA